MIAIERPSLGASSVWAHKGAARAEETEHMSLLSKVKNIPHNLPSGTQPGRGVVPYAIDKGERLILGAVMGAVKGKYREKAVFYGFGIEAWVAVLGSFAAALTSGSLSRHLERAADTGFANYGYAIGAAWGAEQSGHGVAVTRSLPSGKSDVVGVIPPRGAGAFLTANEMASYSQPR